MTKVVLSEAPATTKAKWNEVPQYCGVGPSEAFRVLELFFVNFLSSPAGFLSREKSDPTEFFAMKKVIQEDWRVKHLHKLEISFNLSTL
jgi:hypothetical protein